jgi:hypothetical protein
VKDDFGDDIEPTVPGRGHVTARIRIDDVPHGVNIKLQLRMLDGYTYYTVARDAIMGILAGCVNEGLDVSDIEGVLDEAKKRYFADSTKRWKF